jgi:hypothetical protein
VYYSQNLDSIRERLVEHEHFFEARYLEDSQGSQIWALELRMPTHLGLCGQQAKGFMGSQEKAVTEVGARLSCQLIRLVVEVLVGLGADDIDSAHLAPVFLRRSSRRRCFSCQ